MPAKRKGPAPPNPNYESNGFDPYDHFAQIDTVVPQLPTELRAHLEIERDHYLGTALVAGLNPVTKQEMAFPGSEQVEALIDRGIAAACTIAEGCPCKVHVTIRVHLHAPEPETREGRAGSRVIVSVSEEPLEAPSRLRPLGFGAPINPDKPIGL